MNLLLFIECVNLYFEYGNKVCNILQRSVFVHGIMGTLLRVPLKFLKHYGSMVPRGLLGTLNWSPHYTESLYQLG